MAAQPLKRRDRAGLEQIRQLRLHAGMVFQEFSLFPHLSVLGNLIETPIHVKKMNKKEAIELAEANLAKVGLSKKRDEYPSLVGEVLKVMGDLAHEGRTMIVVTDVLRVWRRGVVALITLRTHDERGRAGSTGRRGRPVLDAYRRHH